MRVLQCLFIITIAFSVSSVQAQKGLQLPYYDWGACPFECCTYRKWKANKPVIAYSDHKDGSPVAFKIEKGEWVTAETGVVITYKAGITKVLKPMRLGYEKEGKQPVLDVKPGNILYTLHYTGEGFDLFWFNGKLYYDQISADKPDPNPPPPDSSLQVISRPVDEWWVKVKNKKGQIGWIKNPPYFENADACA